MFDHFQLSKFLIMPIGVFHHDIVNNMLTQHIRNVTTPLPDSMNAPQVCLLTERFFPLQLSYDAIAWPQIQAFRTGFCLAALIAAQHDLKQERMMMSFLLRREDKNRNDIIMQSCLKLQHHSPTIEDCNVVCPPHPENPSIQNCIIFASYHSSKTYMPPTVTFKLSVSSYTDLGKHHSMLDYTSPSFFSGCFRMDCRR